MLRVQLPLRYTRPYRILQTELPLPPLRHSHRHEAVNGAQRPPRRQAEVRASAADIPVQDRHQLVDGQECPLRRLAQALVDSIEGFRTEVQQQLLPPPSHAIAP